MKAIVLGPTTKDSFVQTVKDDIPTLMLSHASWCPHCVSLTPTWELVKRKLETHNGIHVVEVEYSHMELLPTALKHIRGFPTIQIVKKGKVSSEFQGDRSINAILDFALKNAKKLTPATKSPKSTISSSSKTLKAKKPKSN